MIQLPSCKDDSGYWVENKLEGVKGKNKRTNSKTATMIQARSHGGLEKIGGSGLERSEGLC